MKELKVLLTNAVGFNLEKFSRERNKIRGYALHPPIQLATIASAALEKINDIKIEILDLEFEIRKYFKENEESPLSPRELMKQQIVDKMDKFQPDLIGITVVFSPSHNNALAVANMVKAKNQATQVVCGGNHSTFAYKRMLEKCPDIDFVFLYEGDNTFPLFLEYLQGKVKHEDLRGIAWWDKTTNEVKMSPYAQLVQDLDEIPIPRWDLVPQLYKYQEYSWFSGIQRFGDDNLPTYTMQSARGCIAACTFCSIRSFFGRGVRASSVKRVLEEIDYAYNDLGMKQLEIVDDDFTFDKKRTIEICNELVKRNYDLVWNLGNGVRLGTLDEEVMGAMVAAKCRYISIGVESGNDSTLSVVRKPLSVKMLYKKSEIFQRYPELYVTGNFIIGFPFESDEQTMNTFNVAEDLGLDWCGFNVFTPLVGTPEFQKLDKDNQKDLIDNRDDYSVVFEATRKYRDAVENKKKSTPMHSDGERTAADPEPGHTPLSKLDELMYLKNLEINFLRNKNLVGKYFDRYIENEKGKYHVKYDKPPNIDRAIKDFEGILRFIKKDHAMAHYCLVRAYLSKGDAKTAQQHMNKVSDILSQNPKWAEYFDKLVPSYKMNELKKTLNMDEHKHKETVL
jgi:radical SAM superfamily enzyme YgiQ (UPF0313 family)